MVKKQSINCNFFEVKKDARTPGSVSPVTYKEKL